jgi:hypothetical protein
MFVPDGKGEKKLDLERSRDTSGDYYLVPSNSLVYIKLKQELRLPFYIIGRHNLKIRYVYKGLLLGTGPQVDPGFQGNLFIPLHNFTTSDVRVYINGKHSSFVSIDFVRTTPFSPQIDIPADIKTTDALRLHFKTTGTSRRILIEEEKVKKRLTLEDYLDGAKPRSQLKQFQDNYEKFEKKVRRDIRKMKRWTLIERGALFLAVAGVLIAALNYFRGFVADIKNDTREVNALVATTNLNGYDARISSLETDYIQVIGQIKSLETRLVQNMQGPTNGVSTTNEPAGAKK